MVYKQKNMLHIQAIIIATFKDQMSHIQSAKNI